MKKVFTLFFTALTLFGQSQRLFTEDFNYTVGALTSVGGADVSGGAWTNFSGTGNFLQVTSGNLTYPEYYTSPTAESNKLRLVDFPTSSEDAFRTFTTQTSGSVYASFLINILKSDNLALNSSGGEYFATFLPSTSTSDFRGRVFVRQGTAVNTVNFGINTTSTTATNLTVWDPTNYAINTTHLITFSYQFVAGALNDISKLWVNKPFSTTEPTPSAIAVFPVSGNGAVEFADLGRFVWRQAAFNTPNADVDALVVATSYAAALPLNLTSFTGSLFNRAAMLNWSSANEVNVQGFAIEKGLNGVNFSEIGFVAAKNTAAVNTYSFEDNNVKSGVNYYRLNMKDKDGASRYSHIVLVNSTVTATAQVFPNPARSNMNVSHEKATRGASIQLVSLSGKVLRTVPVQAGATQTGLSVSDLVKGNYMVVFDNGSTKAVTQFSKQ